MLAVLLFTSCPVLASMPARRRFSATKRRQRKRNTGERFQKALKGDNVKLQQTVAQLRKVSRMRQVSTTRILPSFEFEDVKYLPGGSVRPLPNSSARGEMLHIYKIAWQSRLVIRDYLRKGRCNVRDVTER